MSEQTRWFCEMSSNKLTYYLILRMGWPECIQEMRLYGSKEQFLHLVGEIVRYLELRERNGEIVPLPEMTSMTPPTGGGAREEA